MSESFTPAVSVVINTLNRAAYLKNALRALEGLDYPSIEVVVVNGPSTDDTDTVLDGWDTRIKRGRCAEANLAVSRNVGIALASGDIIAFIDDDAAPHPRWITELVEGFRDPRIGALGGFTIDNTGVRWQVRKTVCDRFGNAFNVSNLFDERPLCRPGSPYYPSLLGTNAAFRATAIRQIAGFDHAFAYMLDETDVCLRLIDAGWRVGYQPDAMVYHQFAPSHIRSGDRVARTLYPSAVSKGYFVMRHGAAQSIVDAASELKRFKAEILGANAWLNEHGRIGDEHRYTLDQDLIRGLADGAEKAKSPRGLEGDLDPLTAPPFLPFSARRGLRIALVSQGFPPDNQSGIARWTSLAASGLAALGHQVHVITRSVGEESVTFEEGFWVHRLCASPVGGMAVRETYNVPPDIGDWIARVWREAQHLKSFGLDVLSFPIWDLEGLAVLDDPDLAVVVSLHTTFAMAKPFKPEWTLRPLFGHYMVDRVIAAERVVLAKAPALLANSQAIIKAIGDHYDLDVRARSLVVPHGTPDPLRSRAARATDRERQVELGAPLRVLFVGRFEARKGFDIALQVAMRLARQSSAMEVWFAGGRVDETVLAEMADRGVAFPEHVDHIRFLGEVDREALDDAYVDCDLLLAPSRFESFGLIGIEAMAARRPVFVLAGSGLEEVVDDGISGRVWPETADVADRMAEEIQRLDSNRSSLLDMGLQARLAYERSFTVEQMSTGLERCYGQALSAKHAATQR